MESPFAGTLDGRLYLSKGWLRVDFGSITDLYDTTQNKGWRIDTDQRRYSEIGPREVSTYWPGMINGSPCPNAELPALCKMLGKEKVEGRRTTKWEVVNRHGVPVSLWTDDELQLAVLWHIENETYKIANIKEGVVPGELFKLPAGFTAVPELFKH